MLSRLVQGLPGLDRGSLSMFEVAGILGLTSLAAWFDVRTRRVPNWLTVGAAALGLSAASWASFSNAGCLPFADRVLGLLVGVGLLFVPFILGGLGAGDVKLLGAIGALGGVRVVLVTFLFGTILGGVMSLVQLTVHGQVGRVLRKLAWNLAARTAPGRASAGLAVPYAVAIAGGAILAIRSIGG